MDKCLNTVFVKPQESLKKKKKLPFFRKKQEESNCEPYFPTTEPDNATELGVHHDSLCRPWDSDSLSTPPSAKCLSYDARDYEVDDHMMDTEVPLPVSDRSALTRLLVRGSKFEKPEDRTKPLFSQNSRIYELPARHPKRPKSYGDIVFRENINSGQQLSGRRHISHGSYRDFSSSSQDSYKPKLVQYPTSRQVSGQSHKSFKRPSEDTFLAFCRSLARSSVILSPIDRIADLAERFEVVVVLLELAVMVWLLYQISILVKAISMAIQTLFLPLIIINKLFGIV